VTYRSRLARVIPGGAHTYSRGDDQFPSNAPEILSHGAGAYVYDIQGQRFLDYGMGLRSVTLGYAFSPVIEAAAREMGKGNSLTRASETELLAAELMTDLIPSAEMVKFAKNGSSVTSGAVRVARAFTGRRYVCVPRQQPFFSFDDWFIGTTAMNRGIPQDHSATTLCFDYGDIESLELLFDTHVDCIAAVMMEPATSLIPCTSSCDHELSHESPCPECADGKSGFLHLARRLCEREGALLIFDEIITGFRYDLGGAQKYFGVVPDLSTFGKGMANGFSVAALVGRRDVMEVAATNVPGAERTFLLSATHGAEMCGLGAFMATVDAYRTHDVCRHLWGYGRQLRTGLEAAAAEAGVADYFVLEGPAISLNYVARDATGNASLEFRTLWAAEMIRHGVLIPWVSTSLSHGQAELDLTMAAATKAFATYARALADGIDGYLDGPAVKPVFRKFN
jgi:glutamate-1-semialdehyde 2,1-aminomutase